MAEVKKSFPYRVSLRYMAIPKKLIHRRRSSSGIKSSRRSSSSP
jgi:hypothetical protein